MFDFRGIWSRHKRKLLLTLGVAGGGYALYRLYGSHRRREADLEKQLENERRVDGIIKKQLQTHFDNIQRISETTTLPYALQCLGSRVAEELDLSQITEKLMMGKGQSGALAPKEKLELWEKLKVLSFTRTLSSLWSITMLFLYVRVQVNILGRHLYLETARRAGSMGPFDEGQSLSRHVHQDFLSTADYLSTYAFGSLISNMERAACAVLNEKQLKDPFSLTELYDTMIQILESFMNIGGPNNWINYLLPASATVYQQLMMMSFNGFENTSMLININKLEQLLVEARIVLSSHDFQEIVDLSMRKLVDVLTGDFSGHFESSSSSRVPLAKLLPRVAQVGAPLLQEPGENKFIHILQTLPEVEVFYTLLYTNMPPEF